MGNSESSTSSNNNSNRKSTLGGMALAQARYMAKKIFAEHLERVIHNTDQGTFDIHIYPTADKRDIDKFKGDPFYRIFHAPQKPIKI